MDNTISQRWHQRLESFEKATHWLAEACEKTSLSTLEQAGLIKRFESAFELAWKTLKDLLSTEGFDVTTPRNAFRTALTAGYLDAEATRTLLEALEKRNLLCHTYDEIAANKAVELISSHFAPTLRVLLVRLRARRDTP